MASDIRFSRPAPEEAATLAALARRCFTETFGHLYRPDDLALFLDAQSTERWHGELTDPDFAIMVPYDSAEPVGFAKLGPIAMPVESTGPAMELRQFYLLASEQGTGLAQRLMQWAIDEARARSARELFLSVFVDNTRARRFYERIGFERVGRYVFMVGTQADEDDLMRLAL